MFKKLLVCVLLLSGSSVVQGQHVISTVAGGGPPNNSPALQVSIGEPSSVYKDSAGNLYIASDSLHAIFKVDGNGLLTTVAGIAGGFGFGGDGGPATAAHLLVPTGVFVNKTGDIYISDSGNNRIRKVVASTGIIQTIVGNGTPGFSGDGGPATSAELSAPAGLYVDGAGNIFIMDSANNRVRKVTAATGIIQTVAGNGTAGFSGDGGPAVNAELNLQTCLFCGVSVDTAGNIFIADSGNNRIREVLAATGNIVTFAGDGTAGYTGDGGPATSAELNLPGGLFVDAQGNLFIADAGNGAVREVVAATGNIQTVPSTATIAPLDVFVDTSGHLFVADLISFSIVEVAVGAPNITVAGNGTVGFSGDGGPATSAQLNIPSGVVVDGKGNIFFADLANFRVREVNAASGTIQTVAGSGTAGSSGDDGPATSAQLEGPAGVFVDAAGNLFLSDYVAARIRRVDATTGIITTVVGSGTQGFGGDGGPATSASLNTPAGLYVDSAGNIFFADSGNCRIREVVAATNIIQTVAGNGTCAFAGDGGPATSAELKTPLSVFVDAAGNIYIGDALNGRIREVFAATKIIQTVAGTGTAGFSGDNGPATAAQISVPVGVFVDRTGNLFFWDAGNNRIREVIAATGNIQTVVGNGTFGFSGDGGPAINAEISSFNVFAGVWGDANSNLYLSDSGNARIRKVAGLIAGPPAGISATSGTSQSAAVSTAFSSPLAATVTDASGNDIGGVTVTFTAPTAGASGTFANEVNTAVTNAAGVATSAVFTANGTRGSYTVTATTPGVTGSAAFDLTNASNLTITTTTLPPATVGAAYSATLQATLGTPPYTWSISVGALPAGLTLDASTGAITGTPTTGGASTFTVMVSDSETPVASQSAGLSITVGSGNTSTLIVLPQPTTVGYGTSICFYALDANNNSIAVTWSVSPQTGAGTITPAAPAQCPPGTQPGALPGALYQAPASPSSGSTSQSVTVTALPPSGSCPNSTTNCSAKFTLSGGNGLTGLSTLPLQFTASAGSTSNESGIQLTGVPATSNIPFTLTCSGLPVGAGCIWVAPHTTTVIQTISGNFPKAWCSIFTTGPGTTAGLLDPRLVKRPPTGSPTLYTLGFLCLGILALLLTIVTPNQRRTSGRFALATVALVCISISTLGACGGFSKSNVAPPTAQITPAGTYQIQLLATPPPGSGFVQSQLIIPLTVTP